MLKSEDGGMGTVCAIVYELELYGRGQCYAKWKIRPPKALLKRETVKDGRKKNFEKGSHVIWRREGGHCRLEVH